MYMQHAFKKLHLLEETMAKKKTAKKKTAKKKTSKKKKH
jgi:hypothetical protein